MHFGTEPLHPDNHSMQPSMRMQAASCLHPWAWLGLPSIIVPSSRLQHASMRHAGWAVLHEACLHAEGEGLLGEVGYLCSRHGLAWALALVPVVRPQIPALAQACLSKRDPLDSCLLHKPGQVR